MGKITGEGIPTKETMGYIGDVYIDSTTEKEYVCTFSCVIGNDIDCKWRETEKNPKIKNPSEKKDTKSIPNRRKDYTSYNKRSIQ